MKNSLNIALSFLCMVMGTSLSVHAATAEQLSPGTIIELPASWLRLRRSQVVEIIKPNLGDGRVEVQTVHGKRAIVSANEIRRSLPWTKLADRAQFHQDAVFNVTLVIGQYEAPQNSRFHGKMAYVLKGFPEDSPNEYFFVSRPENSDTFGFTGLEDHVKARLRIEFVPSYFRIAPSVLDYTFQKAEKIRNPVTDSDRAAIRLAQTFKEDWERFGRFYSAGDQSTWAPNAFEFSGARTVLACAPVFSNSETK